MNSNFSQEQIEAYASAFEVRDAIWCNGKWYEVVENKKNGNNKLTAYADGNIFVINDGQDGECQSGTPYGFWIGGCNENPYRVTTLRDYELQGGEKLVWLGEDVDLTFGGTYVVEKNNERSGRLEITDDAGDRLLIGSNYFNNLMHWGVIPRWEQVEEKPSTESSSERKLYERYYKNLNILIKEELQSLVKRGDYKELIELAKLAIEVKEKGK